MAVTPPPSVDIEMADAIPATPGLTFPPEGNGPLYEHLVEGKNNPPENQLDTLENIHLESPTIATTESTTMARRSARNANKPKPVVASPTRLAKKKIIAKASSAKKPKWTAEKLLTDSKSPLASADLRTILSQPAAWDILSPSERAEITALFPQGTRILGEGTDDARPDFEALLNDNNFRHDCATYTDNIAQGKHDPEWLEQAWAARERRRAGDFDTYLAQKFEHEWSCKLPDALRPHRDDPAPSAEDSGRSKDDGESQTPSNGPHHELTSPGVPPAPHPAPPSETGNEVQVAVEESRGEDQSGHVQADAEIHDSQDEEAQQSPSAVDNKMVEENASESKARVTLGSPVPEDNRGRNRVR